MGDEVEVLSEAGAGTRACTAVLCRPAQEPGGARAPNIGRRLHNLSYGGQCLVTRPQSCASLAIIPSSSIGVACQPTRSQHRQRG